MVLFRNISSAWRRHDIAKILFILSGTALYFKFIIPINPYSSERLVRCRQDCTLRYITALRIIRTHLFTGIFCQAIAYWAYVKLAPELTILPWLALYFNIFVNLYPILVQWYIAIKCNRIAKIPLVNQGFLGIKVFLCFA